MWNSFGNKSGKKRGVDMRKCYSKSKFRKTENKTGGLQDFLPPLHILWEKDTYGKATLLHSLKSLSRKMCCDPLLFSPPVPPSLTHCFLSSFIYNLHDSIIGLV